MKRLCQDTFVSEKVLVQFERFVRLFRSEGPTVSSPVREGGVNASF
jgi:hypothetical protein